MSDKSPSTAKTQERVIRVFVSSTFRDMHAEREELVKRVFPRLRKLCEERGVTWGEVDLRWGITEEEKAEGKVLPICLAEIQRSRPYFIGVLGERYGWVPDEISHELIEQEPWLADHLKHSVTELEILHGVLRNIDMAEHAYFYFRDPSYINSLPDEKKTDYREDPAADEIEKYGLEEATHRAKERREKLVTLKQRIRESGLPFREGYPDPKAFGELVLNDLTGVIDTLYPKGTEPSPLEREAAEHEAFAQSRARVYIGRQEYFDRLGEYVRGDGPPLVILGESGSGKSALLANWAIKYRESHPDVLLIKHFIGATPYSADWAAMLRRIMGELKRRFNIEQEIPDKPDALRMAFANYLHMASASCSVPSPLAGEGQGEGGGRPSRIIIILDALNQLEDRNQAPDLVWLPPVIPPNVRLILSALSGRPLDELKKRGWLMSEQTLAVKPLELNEKKILISSYLKQYSKGLSNPIVERIASSEQTANPLYLKALLEELRLFGKHEELDSRISYYLEAGTIDDLYEKILERYEGDYERDRPGLVRDAMRLLWAARRGLSETELLELLGTEGRPLQHAYWSPLYLAAEQSLVSRSGLTGFSHDYFRQAVLEKYLPAGQDQKAAHMDLADYFETRELGTRKIDELPYQLSEAKSWNSLYDLLSNLTFFDAAWTANQFEVKAYWARIEDNSLLRIVDAYQAVLHTPGEVSNTNYVWHVAMLLADTGHPEEALSLREYLVDHFRQSGDKDGLQASLGNQANILYARGDLDGAMALHKEKERICRELGNKDGLQRSLGNQALILDARGDLDGAMALHKEEERICRELGNKDGLSYSLGNQANILDARGDLDGAMALYKEQERISKELGNKDGLAISLVNQANLLSEEMNRPREALPLAEEAYRLATDHGLNALAGQIKPILDAIRTKIE